MNTPYRRLLTEHLDSLPPEYRLRVLYNAVEVLINCGLAYIEVETTESTHICHTCHSSAIEQSPTVRLRWQSTGRDLGC